MLSQLLAGAPYQSYTVLLYRHHPLHSLSPLLWDRLGPDYWRITRRYPPPTCPTHGTRQRRCHRCCPSDSWGFHGNQSRVHLRSCISRFHSQCSGCIISSGETENVNMKCVNNNLKLFNNTHIFELNISEKPASILSGWLLNCDWSTSETCCWWCCRAWRF